jgi:hypothetical protein
MTAEQEAMLRHLAEAVESLLMRQSGQDRATTFIWGQPPCLFHLWGLK